MSNSSRFKIAFFAMSAGIFVGTLVYGLFEVDFSDKEALLKLFLKSLITGVVSGLVLGLLNMFFKFTPRQETKSK
jgi:xanthosine utilization system XapX-like protein